MRVCECTMKGMSPRPIDGTEYEIECDMIISAIGQMADLAEGLERLDSGRGSIAINPVYQVQKMPKHFAGGDALRPHLLTTAIGHGRVAAETIGEFLKGQLGERRPKVDTHHFDLLAELHDGYGSRALRPPAEDRHLIEQVRRSQLRRSRQHPDHPARCPVQGPFLAHRARAPRRAARPRGFRARRFPGAHRRVDRDSRPARKASAA